MGGWFLDVLVAYLFKSLTRLLRMRGSAAWPTQVGTVTSSHVHQPALGCATAEIAYMYKIGTSIYTGMTEKPSFMGSAEKYAACFVPESRLIVRVKPGAPEISVVRDEDQSLEHTDSR